MPNIFHTIEYIQHMDTENLAMICATLATKEWKIVLAAQDLL